MPIQHGDYCPFYSLQRAGGMTDLTMESTKALATAVSGQIRDHGWALLCTPYQDTLLHVCTLGLELTQQHQDLEVLGLTPEMGSQFLNHIAARITAGERYRSGDFFSNLVEGFDLFLVENPVSMNGPPVTQGRLRLIWPDARSKYPWNDDCDPQCATQRFVLPQDGLDLESLYALLALELGENTTEPAVAFPQLIS